MQPLQQVAKTPAPRWAPTVVVLGLTVEWWGVGGRNVEGRSKLWRSCTHEFYEFRPFLEEVTALRLGALRQSTEYMCVNYRKCEPLSQRRGVAYIECARTPAIPHYKEFNVHKEGKLLETPAIKFY